MPSHYLTGFSLDAGLRISIQEEEFTALRVSMDCLIHSLYIEEKYDFIVQNRIALERALADCNDLPNQMQDLRYAKSEINRHFANILTTTRLYIDQGTRYGTKLDRLFSEPLVRFKSRLSQQYDARLGYRVMESLRNFVQHRGDAVHLVVFDSHKEYVQDQMRIVKRTDAYLEPSELRAEKKFNAAVLDELENLSSRRTAQEFLMDYLEGLRDVHEEFRASTKAKNVEAQECISDAFDRYSVTAGDVIDVRAIEENDRGEIERSASIIRDPIHMREFYESKNPSRSTSR